MIFICVEADDIEIVNYVDSLSNKQLSHYSRCYTVKSLRHYVTIQYHWMEEAKYFAGLTLKHNPTQMELVDHWNAHQNAERFRAYYIVKYPDRVNIIEPEYHI
jgi:GTPase SAR1 family protein